MSRDGAILAFLAGSAFERARIEPLAQDASFRRYWRLSEGPSPAVLMDAPPPEDVRPFLRIAAHLEAIGLSVPRVFKADTEAGFVLEEDLGDGLLSVIFDGETASGLDAQAPETTPPPPLRGRAGVGGDRGTDWGGSTPPPIPLPQGEGGQDQTNPLPQREGGQEPATLLHAATDALVVLQRAAPPPGLPAWTAQPMAETALGTLFDWWWPAAFGAPAPDAARAEVAAALHTILAPLTTGPRCFVHRDFFAGNLLSLPNRTGPRAIGIIDFQGAAIGHPAYDLVSLLQDARRDIPPAIAADVLARYLALRPELDPAAFRAAYAACAAQRHLRVACQWVRLALRDNRPNYLAYGPRTWALLAQMLTDPAVAPLARALDHWIPAEKRGNPPGLPA